MNQGKSVFAQLMSMIPEYEFDKCVDAITGTIESVNLHVGIISMP